ncbi:MULTISPECIES: aminotransferase class V-fold PLP-dependent enzyme [Burkholderiaceae]|uniref:Cysteine desulfurase n=1 Tax=Caballeronia sordidicola TaxID=196367 RepID=A0A242MBX5_CABSO|nr:MULTISPECIES: aminotransferase class V-fold PLP-dependent enzyme [Burkholderiaceae]AME27150.1 class V aminotransferase [Burkholderia sp. PAMC 26561]AME27702.1 class V aminotransferase [Burkholderia sp. PAMC 26561]OTP68712.1 Cysteine desulfurase [Caballeronia sordidicola]
MSTPLTHAAIEALRAQTPGAHTNVHFNHAGASIPSSATLRAISEHLEREASLGPMEAGVAATEEAEQARTLAAVLLNAQPDEIALTAGNSQGWGAAFAAMENWRPGDRILVGRHEWGGNLAAMYLRARRSGTSIEVIPSRESGTVDPDALAAMLDERVRLIALTWLPANGGLINPAETIGAVARRHGIPYFVDAAQAVGQLPVDVTRIGCDVLSTAGRKALRGPRGTGLLYVRRDFLHRLTPACVDRYSAPLDAHGEPVLREDAGRFESAETPVALRCGLVNALREALAGGIPNIRYQIDRLANRLRKQLSEIPSIKLLDDGIERSGLVAFNATGRDAKWLQRGLAAQGIAIGTSGIAYTPFDMQARGLSEVARASVSYLTTESEIDRLVDTLRDLLR